MQFIARIVADDIAADCAFLPQQIDAMMEQVMTAIELNELVPDNTSVMLPESSILRLTFVHAPAER